MLKEDEPASYYRFIRANPDSPHIDEAKERLAFHKVRRDPTLENFDEFYSKYPDSTLLGDLRPLVEAQAFEVARSVGTVAAYESFLERFPDGPFRSRAEGNLEYERAGGYVGRFEELALFAQSHPDSDFAVEARRSVESMQGRQARHFDRISLWIDLAANQVQRAELIDAFTQMAVESYQRYRVKLDTSTAQGPGVPESVDAEPGQLWLVIRHRETVSDARLDETGGFIPRSVTGSTTVSLQANADEAPIWEQTHSLSIDSEVASADSSVLLVEEAADYWTSWFAPVVSWDSSLALRPRITFDTPPVAIDAARDRAALLFADGHVEILDLADPAAPYLLGESKRAAHPESWEGVRIHDDRLLVFGRGGLAMVTFDERSPALQVLQESRRIGAVAAVESLGDGGPILVGSERGLLLMEQIGELPARLVSRPIFGLASVGDAVIFTDGETLFISTLDMLRKQKVLAQLRLDGGLRGGEYLSEARLRSFGSIAVLFGGEETLVFELKDIQRPQVLARLDSQVTGRVSDVTKIAGRVFLLGERGLQQLSSDAKRVVESIEVTPRARIARMGRHLVATGEEGAQVVDASPFVSRGVVLPVASWDDSDGGDATQAAPAELME